MIAGPSVARGYVLRPEMTAEKFIPCPYHLSFKKMYRTGDLVRWNKEGKIEFLGRIDSQVKLRGFRIEVSEIEFHLANFPGVMTGVVVLRSDDDRSPYLAAYIVCEAQLHAAFRESEFRSHLLANLPHYMIPSRFVAIKKIPRSATGKLNRNALPKPPVARMVSICPGNVVPPSSPMEVLLAFGRRTCP